MRRGATVVFDRSYGVRPGSAYDVGSVAKSFTAAAVVLLEAQGRLRVDDTLATVFAAVPAARRSITVAEVLTHTAGFPPYFSSDRERLDEEEAVRRILATPVRGHGRFVYSDAGYTLLAAVVQRTSGEPFERFLRDRMFARARLRHTGFAAGDLHGAPLAHGLRHGVDLGPAGSQAPLSWSILGAGGILSTSADLAQWAVALRGGAVLGRRGLTELWRGRVPTGGPGGARAAYGWVTGHDPRGRPVVAVGGGTDFGFTADLRVYPGPGLAIAALSSTDRVEAAQLGRRAAEAFLR